MKQKKFQKSFKAKANLRSSSKLIKSLLNGKKKKWKVIAKPLEIFNLDFPAKSKQNLRLDFQACSDSFAKSWKTKQNFQDHFLVQRQSHYKKLAKKAKSELSSLLKNQKLQSNLPNPKLAFLILWESRLDLLLWKSKLVSSLPQARQLILQGYVKVNSKIAKYPNQILEEADFIQIQASASIYKTLLQSFKEPKLGLLPPFYVETHYTSLSFSLVQKPSISELLYTFNLNLKNLPV